MNEFAAWYTLPDSIRLRWIFFTGMVSGTITYIAFSGDLVSTLTAMSEPVKQFNDLLLFKFRFTVHEFSEPFQKFLKVTFA